MSKTVEDKIKLLEEKEEKIKAQKKKLKAQLSQKERKERTRRLIQIGAIVESVTKTKIEDLEAFEEYVIRFKNQIARTQKNAIEDDQNESRKVTQVKQDQQLKSENESKDLA